jgi:fermentation-respiration switch protein FrsA (DUF1100 family)
MKEGTKAKTAVRVADYMAEEAFPKAVGTEDKELFIIEGATHIETYRVDEYVNAALRTLTTFFARTI